MEINIGLILYDYLTMVIISDQRLENIEILLFRQVILSDSSLPSPARVYADILLKLETKTIFCVNCTEIQAV